MSRNQNNNIVDVKYVDLLPLPTLIINEEGTIVHLSQYTYLIFGNEAKHLLQQPIITVAPQLFPSINMGELENMLKKPKLQQMKNVQLHALTQVFPNTDLFIQPCVFEDQSSIALTCVTSQDTINNALLLKELSDLRNGIYQTLMMVTLDEDGFILDANQAFLRASQWTPKRVIGKSFWQLFPQTTNTYKLPEQIWRILQQGQIWQGEAALLTKNDQEYWGDLVIFPTFCPIQQVQRYILIGRDISKAKTELHKLQKYAYVDAETGLHNAYWLENEIGELVEDKRNFSFVYLSIDKFYTLKEMHNTPLDESLGVAFTERLKTYFQDSIIARINETDFALLTPLSEWFIQGFLNYLDGNPIYHEQFALPISVSGGITRFPAEFTTYTQLMRTSLATISAVREAGGNQIVALSADRHRELNRAALLETRLLKALDEKNLHVLYQPQVNTQTQKICGVEALVRWDDDVVGSVAPGELIPLAESTGLIHNIGNYMLREACQQAVSWKKAGTPITVSINASVREFRDKNMADVVLQTLAETRCPAELIQFEITEKFALEAELVGSIQKQLETLQEAGVSFVLDDFGTGYSSFRYLQILPISAIKIDDTFIQAIEKSEKTQKLVESMIQLGKTLDLMIVAEGVETTQQLKWLQTTACDILQGYAICKPIAVADINKRL